MDEQIPNRIASWLLSSGIQIQAGPESGAVAGWLDANGKPAFAYPEITGYYLTCLVFMRQIGRTEPAIASNLQRAVAWLHAKCRHGIPLTRYYVPPDVPDWRNDAFFSFDVAMVLRGLASVKGMVEEGTRHETEEALRRYVRRFVSSDRQINPWIRRTKKSLPDRWSTRPGPFQLKTAGALMCLDRLLDDGLQELSINTFTRWRTSFVKLANELHASLYAVEGLILFGLQGYEEAWTTAAEHYKRCLEHFTHSRSDVVAQALRAGCLLQCRGLLHLSDCDRALKKMADILVGFVGGDGGVFYSIEEPSSFPHQNAWSAMFAYQALTFYSMRSPDIKFDKLLLI